MEYAIRTFTNYLKQAFEASGLRWDRDNEQEIKDAIEDIFNEAAMYAREQLQEHLEEGHR